MELDLGCRENVEVRECFSSPEILELKAQCELACYRGAAPNCLQCPFRLAGPIFKVIPRHLCRRRDCMSVWRYKFFVHNATAFKENNNHSSHPGSAHACFLRMRTFHVPFHTLPFGLGIIVEHP